MPAVVAAQKLHFCKGFVRKRCRLDIVINSPEHLYRSRLGSVTLDRVA
jgi:hypothetical protein